MRKCAINLNEWIFRHICINWFDLDGGVIEIKLMFLSVSLFAQLTQIKVNHHKQDDTVMLSSLPAFCEGNPSVTGGQWCGDVVLAWISCWENNWVVVTRDSYLTYYRWQSYDITVMTYQWVFQWGNDIAALDSFRVSLHSGMPLGLIMIWGMDK